eukprot:1079074-Pyramimonas_sp.AAC.1
MPWTLRATVWTLAKRPPPPVGAYAPSPRPAEGPGGRLPPLLRALTSRTQLSSPPLACCSL